MVPESNATAENTPYNKVRMISKESVIEREKGRKGERREEMIVRVECTWLGL